jgi:peptidoglycan/LPS O-acetylase OafA/YrhL
MNVSVRPSASVGAVEGFLPHLEGLRALAVLLVLLYHGRLGLDGGYVGVDVFFVLSGFLVTSLLLREHAVTGRVSVASFWARRARRLLPVSSLVVVLSALVGTVLLESQRLSRLAGDVFAAASFSANFRFLTTHGDYLGGLSLPSPLLHFWSLAVEEQFYLLWPLLLAVLLRAPSARFRRLIVGGAAALLVCASFLLSMHVTAESPAAGYYLLPSRAWEMLAGALLALAWSPLSAALPGRRSRSVCGAAGLLLVLIASFAFDSSTPFPGPAALLPVVGTLGVLLGGADSVSGALLSRTPLRWLGARSYGVYLWHWPVLVFAAAAGLDRSVWSRIGWIGLSLALADVSFRALEAPVRRNVWLGSSVRRPLVMGSFLSGTLLLLGAVLTVVPAANVSSAPAAVAQRSSPVVADSRSSATFPTVPSRGVLEPAAGQSPRPRVLLLGDSTLAPLRWFVDGWEPFARLGGSAEFVLDAESCRRLARTSCVGREERRPSSAVEVLAERSAAGERFPLVVLMAGYHSTPDEFADEFRELLDAARSHGVERLFVVGYRESLAFPLEGSRGRLSVFGYFNDVLRTHQPSRPGPEVVVLDWNAFTANASDWFRSDGIHVNLAGALGLGEFLLREILSRQGLPCGDETLCRPPGEASRTSDLLERFDVEDTDEHCYEVGRDRGKVCRRDSLG